MAFQRFLLVLAILLAWGEGANAQLLGSGIGGVSPAGAVGGLPNVPVTTIPGNIPAPALPAAPTPPVLSNPIGAALAPLPSVTSPVTSTIGNAATTVTQTVQATTATVARDTVGRPVGQTVLGRDERGFPIVAGEVLAMSPSPESLNIARGLNFRVVRQDQLGALGLATAVLSAPEGMTTVEALAAIRRADPAGTYDYANIYNPAGGQVSPAPSAPMTIPQPGLEPSLRVGMIDGGVDAHHSAFANARVITRDLAGSSVAPASQHGTAVASLLVGRDKSFSGYLPGATVFAADVFGGEPTGGSAQEIALALNWLAENNVAVVNISLAGPPNAILGAAVKAFVASGRVLVAATGNDGPAAPPNYPAAYPGVVGVTAANSQHHLALEANPNGARFAALGVDVQAAVLPAGYDRVSGSSFASPLVAARFALLVLAPDKHKYQSALDALSRQSVPLTDSRIGYLAPPPSEVAQR